MLRDMKIFPCVLSCRFRRSKYQIQLHSIFYFIHLPSIDIDSTYRLRENACSSPYLKYMFVSSNSFKAPPPIQNVSPAAALSFFKLRIGSRLISLTLMLAPPRRHHRRFFLPLEEATYISLLLAL